MLRRLVLFMLLLATPALAWALPDYGSYQALLDRYLVRTDPASKTSDTRFDYERLHLDEKIWRTHRSATLKQLHDELLVVRPSELAPADRIAWAINTYNFMVIERATMRLLIPGKRFTRYRSVAEMRNPEGRFFTTPIGEVEGRSLTLAEFERRYVYGDTTDMLHARAMRSDPRRALALCSGHLGDPPLAPQVYRGEAIESQLDAAARIALAQPRFARYTEATWRLDLSEWFNAHLLDCGGTPQSIVPFLERYGPQDLRKALKRHAPVTVNAGLRLDANLNQAVRKDAMPDAPATGTQ